MQKAGAGTTKVATTEALAGAEYVMVYFSAHVSTNKRAHCVVDAMLGIAGMRAYT